MPVGLVDMSGAGSFDSSSSEHLIISAEPMHSYVQPVCVHKLLGHMASTCCQQTPFVSIQSFPLVDMYLSEACRRQAAVLYLTHIAHSSLLLKEQ